MDDAENDRDGNQVNATALVYTGIATHPTWAVTHMRSANQGSGYTRVADMLSLPTTLPGVDRCHLTNQPRINDLSTLRAVPCVVDLYESGPNEGDRWTYLARASSAWPDTMKMVLPSLFKLYFQAEKSSIVLQSRSYFGET